MSWTLIPQFTPASRGGVCSCCGTDQKVTPERGVLSPEIYIEMEGDFDVCQSCIEEAAYLIGFVPSVEVDIAFDLVDEHKRYSEELFERCTQQEADIAVLKRLLGVESAEDAA